MQRSPMTRLRDQSFNRLIPNILTLLGLCAGMTAIRLALVERWELAVAAIAVAAVLDALDGRIARLLDTSSKFGAELDSLADVVGFGVVPGLLLYIWTMHDAGGIGWAVTLLFAVCCSLRLARFNTKLDNADLPAWTGRFFVGVPAPAAAGLALTPMMAHFESATKPAILEAATQPINRRSSPEEQAAPLVFLNSSAASYMNGLALPVDGGLMGGISTGRIDPRTLMGS